MSTILKALKKTEREKQLSSGGKVSLAREILRSDGRRRRTSRLRLPLIVVGLLSFGVGAGVFLVRTEEAPSIHQGQKEPSSSLAATANLPPLPVVVPEIVPVSPPQTVAEPVVQPEDAAAVVAQPEQKTGTPVEMSSLPPTEPAIVAQVKVTAPDQVPPSEPSPKHSVAKSAVPAKASVATPLSPPVAQPVTVKQTLAATPRSRTASTPRSLLTPVVVPSRQEGWLVQEATDSKAPSLRVSEIHWRPVAKERLAVVNDLPVLEGVDIEGIRVDRIFKDRIRFVVNGRYLEVKLSSSPAP